MTGEIGKSTFQEVIEARNGFSRCYQYSVEDMMHQTDRRNQFDPKVVQRDINRLLWFGIPPEWKEQLLRALMARCQPDCFDSLWIEAIIYDQAVHHYTSMVNDLLKWYVLGGYDKYLRDCRAVKFLLWFIENHIGLVGVESHNCASELVFKATKKSPKVYWDCPEVQEYYKKALEVFYSDIMFGAYAFFETRWVQASRAMRVMAQAGDKRCLKLIRSIRQALPRANLIGGCTPFEINERLSVVTTTIQILRPA